jgi:thiamine biosynthesis lipoprotein
MTLEANTTFKKCRIPLALVKGIFCLAIAINILGCEPNVKVIDPEEFKVELSGEAQGTTWHVTYYDLRKRNFKLQIDSALKRIDQSISTYQTGSVIDRWNKSEHGALIDDLFLEVLLESWRNYVATNGAFDPTIMPLVKYWGFGPERFTHPEHVSISTIDSLRQFLLFDSLELVYNDIVYQLDDVANESNLDRKFFLTKPISNIQLDFNAIGQGWSVDKVASLLDSKGIEIFFVEIGGEIVAGKTKPSGELWRFGIDKPLFDSSIRELQAIIQLRNRAMATSGNYRKFYEKDGVKLSHTIDPSTGYPVNHGLLSATVLSSTAGEADAMATAFMVMGKDSVLSFLKAKPYLNEFVYLIYDSSGVTKTYTSPEIAKLIESVKEN